MNRIALPFALSFAFIVVSLALQSTNAQILVDTTITWQGYTQSSVADVQVFHNPDDDTRPYTVLVKELASNKGISATADIIFLTEEIGRTLAFNPTKATWVLHWGAFSFENAKRSKKELFLRATFKRTKRNQISSPQWRVIDRVEVELLTDRLFDL